MAFSFRLEKVLRHREYLLDHARQALLAALRLEQQASSRLRDLERRLSETSRQWRDGQSNGMDVATFLSYRDHILALEQQLPQLQLELQKAASAVARQRDLVLVREQAVKVLEKLKDRHHQDHILENTRNAQKRLDETVIVTTRRDTEDV